MTQKKRIVHYIHRGGQGNDLTSECGKSMDTPNASYTTIREKTTCRKCLKHSVNLPDVGGDPRQMIRRYDVQLEIDCSRGVIYCHDKNTDISILRICGVPMPAMRGLAGTPVEFIPQMDIALRENLPPIAGVANLALARREPEINKAFAKRQAAKAKKKTPTVCFRMYEDGEFQEESFEPNEKAAIRVYRKKHGLSARNGVVVKAKLTLKRK